MACRTSSASDDIRALVRIALERRLLYPRIAVGVRVDDEQEEIPIDTLEHRLEDEPAPGPSMSLDAARDDGEGVFPHESTTKSVPSFAGAYDTFDDAQDTTDVVTPFSPGSFFADRFRLGESLGSGGMGTVFRAEDLLEQRPVAIKILLKGPHDRQVRERFEREQQILESIDHPGIVSILRHGYAAHGRIPWLAMELLEGETLRQAVSRVGPMDPDRVASILYACAAALEAAHAQGVIHRDLKPDNIFLPADGPTVKLLDFGLSLSAKSKKLTATGTVIGTPRYMAPEQIASAHTSGVPADIYALGVVTYECLTGESPFVASDQGQLLGAILQGKLEPLANRRPELASAIGPVLERAMSRLPEDRYATPTDFAAAFAEAAGVRPSQVRFSMPVDLSKKRARASRVPSAGLDRKKWVVVVVLGLLAAAASAVITYSLMAS